MIQDEGPGIAAGEHTKVFDRFFTSRNRATANISGAGLGLSITKLIIERAGGSIKFDENSQHGAKCLIDLPCSEFSDKRTAYSIRVFSGHWRA